MNRKQNSQWWKKEKILLVNRSQSSFTAYVYILIKTCCSKITEKDVQRTDRCQAFFEGDENQNLVMMKDLLMTYNMFNFDLGNYQTALELALLYEC